MRQVAGTVLMSHSVITDGDADVACCHYSADGVLMWRAVITVLMEMLMWRAVITVLMEC